MGEEPEQFEGGDGVSCWTCWGAGKPWESQGIPAVVTVTFGGIIVCPEWCDAPNGVFTLAQDPIVVCQWKTIIPNWCHGFGLYISWILAEAESSLVAFSLDNYAYYFHNDIGPCQTYFINDGYACFEDHWIGYNGIGVIT